MGDIAYYKVNTSKIVFEKFDDETVLINLESGNYYGLMGVSKTIFELIEAGADKQKIITFLSESYKIEYAKIEEEIIEFIDLLISEEIVFLTKEHSSMFNQNNNSINSFVGVYEKPTLEIYSDMQDLILLDPIHDVSSKGWPNVKEDESNSNQSTN